MLPLGTRFPTNNWINLKVFIINVLLIFAIIHDIGLLDSVENISILLAIEITESTPSAICACHVISVIQVTEISPLIISILLTFLICWFALNLLEWCLRRLLFGVLSLVKVLDKCIHVVVTLEDIYTVVQVILNIISINILPILTLIRVLLTFKLEDFIMISRSPVI